MLTKRQNLLETIHGGNPDRFVKQYEAFHTIRGNPLNDVKVKYGEPPVANAWGVTRVWPIGTPGAFPVHDEEHIVVKDIENWKEYVKAPRAKFTPGEWEPFIAQAEAIDRNEEFVTIMMTPGIFEQCHYLCEIQRCLIYLYENPDEMEELIKYITDYELQMAEEYCTYLKPDAIIHHDDWGTQISTFMSVDMFEEFFQEPAKEVYGYYHDHGVELCVHHSDSFAATLVPNMIDIGIDIWQGCLAQSNDIPDLVKKYGGQISFMGGIDSGVVDREGWTSEVIEQEVRRMCTACGKHYYIPCITQGGPGNTYDGVYDCISEKIDMMSAELF